ncbi:MAG: phenylalanine--tRNA ligase subunit beta [Planctomycetota bacterium]
MWLSLSWLGEFVDLGGLDPEKIAEDLTMRTALIESVKSCDPHEKLVVGRVLERMQHPDADRLSVCQVDVGQETLEIVCGAPNVAAGQNVVVAGVGTVLPGDFMIKKSQIRGVTSLGMICSERELELGEGHDGIMVLEEGIEPGRPFRELRGVADVLLEIDNKSVTHRPDLWGHEGFARELSAIYGRDFKTADLDVTLQPGTGPIEVRIEAPELCGRYCALFVEGALGGPSPAWMQRRLIHCGLRPLSLGVDLSNYVMLEIGQPNHPFDAGRIGGGMIRVRRANPGEELLTLDGVQRKLPAGALVIADENRPIALAGIIGGKDSGISDKTEQCVVESAWFEPVAVRATSGVLALRTDAVARFEKSLDPGLSERGLRRYAALLKNVVPSARIAGQYVSAGSFENPRIQIALRPARVRAKLGLDFPVADMLGCLIRLGFGVQERSDALQVDVPAFRGPRDLTCEDDLIEEVGRIHGYEKIPASLPNLSCAPVRLQPLCDAWRRSVQVLTGRMQFCEVTSYPYVEEKILERAGGVGDEPYLRIRNPLQQSASRLRRSQIPWLLEFVDRNVKSVEEVRLFECGRVFLPREGGLDLPYEPMTLSAVLARRVMGKGAEGSVIRRLKGVLEELSREMRRPLRFEALSGNGASWAHPVRSASVWQDGLQVGCLAEIHPDITDGFGWRGEVAAFEVDLIKIVDTVAEKVPYEPPARFPAVRVDLSFLLPFTLRYDTICGETRSVAPELESIELLDEYVSKEMEPGQRSLTLRLSFRDRKRTLSDADVSAQIEAVRGRLAELGATLRGDEGPGAL